MSWRRTSSRSRPDFDPATLPADLAAAVDAHRTALESGDGAGRRGVGRARGVRRADGGPGAARRAHHRHAGGRARRDRPPAEVKVRIESRARSDSYSSRWTPTASGWRIAAGDWSPPSPFPPLPERVPHRPRRQPRGDRASRLPRLSRALGLSTVAVYSEADRDAPHVKDADRAVLLRPRPPRESYLSVERILAAARESGADAVHPGYGFLSENWRFCRGLACRRA